MLRTADLNLIGADSQRNVLFVFLFGVGTNTVCALTSLRIVRKVLLRDQLRVRLVLIAAKKSLGRLKLPVDGRQVQILLPA